MQPQGIEHSVQSAARTTPAAGEVGFGCVGGNPQRTHLATPICSAGGGICVKHGWVSSIIKRLTLR